MIVLTNRGKKGAVSVSPQQSKFIREKLIVSSVKLFPWLSR